MASSIGPCPSCIWSEKLHFKIANERSLILFCDQREPGTQCILCNPKPSQSPATVQETSAWRSLDDWTHADCEFYSSGSARHVWEQKTPPVQHVSPALLRSQEALNIVKFSIFINRYLGGGSSHSPVFLPSPIYLVRLGHLPRAERWDKRAGES